MPTSTTSPLPLAQINTTGLRKRSDSNGMGSPTSLLSSFSSSSPLTAVFTENSRISGEDPASMATVAPLPTSSEAPKTTRPHTLYHTQTMESRRSTESVDSQARSLKFNDFSRGRHSNLWLFRGLSVRGTFRKIVSRN